MNSQELTVNSKQLSVISVLLASLFLFSGCEGFRYAATEAQKENAWRHKEVCAAAADKAVDENASSELCGLTELAHEQSTAFILDYGLPQNPLVTSVHSPLAGGELTHSNNAIKSVAAKAQADSIRKPDVFEVADGVMEIGIAVAGLIGGVYGIRIASYLRQAREKSTALIEIIAGNELFKQLYPEQANRFKEAQQKQTPQTRQIVSKLKAG